MTTLKNLDLISVGIAIAWILILGFMIFFSNRKSTTNKTFFYLSWAISLWSLFNYLAYHVETLQNPLWFVRYVMFSAVWFAFFMFRLAYVFPKESVEFPSWYRSVLLPVTAFVSLLTLTPFVISGVAEATKTDHIAGIAVGPGIIIFGLVAGGLDITAIISLIVKMLRATGIARKQLVFILIGVGITLSLLLAFNFVLPAFFNILRFGPLGAVFVFPFMALTAYAIFQHHLLSVKVFTTGGVAFLFTIVNLIEFIFSENTTVLLFRSGVFLLVLIFSIFLIRSVLKEVEQREEFERLNKELEEAKEKLEELNKFKTQLLSLASHQVKSPLAAIKGFATILSQGLYGPLEPKIKETIDKMYSSADGLLGLINILLDMRKVEEGRMDYQFAKTDLTVMVRGVVEEFQPFADQNKLALSCEGSKDPVYVNADSLKLKQVVQNLIDNAIKYTPSGFVKVALTVAGGTATISVSDSGFGIPANLVPHLFEEFIRDERVKQKILGTGLGLFIARKIVEAHGGTIKVESAGEGKGSTFSVSLKAIS